MITSQKGESVAGQIPQDLLEALSSLLSLRLVYVHRYDSPCCHPATEHDGTLPDYLQANPTKSGCHKFYDNCSTTQ